MMSEPKEFRRITVADAERAYAWTGLKPKAKVVLHQGCACPIMACALHEHRQLSEYHPALALAVESLGLTVVYANGFIKGFDGDNRPMSARPHTESGLGYADGQVVRNALLGPEEVS